MPLAQSDQPAAVILRECRDRIDRLALPEERGSYRAVTEMLARLRYNRGSIEAIFGRSGVMIESPWLKEIVEEREAEQQRKDLIDFLAARFDSVPAEVKAGLQTITDSGRLQELIRWAGRCPDLDAFRARACRADH